MDEGAFGPENPPSVSDVIEGRLVLLGMRALELGTNVVLDFGLWSRDERSALKQAAADVGALVVMCYFELGPNEQRNRLDQRLAAAPQETWPISDEELAEFAAKFDIPSAAELDGSEPIGQPPDGGEDAPAGRTRKRSGPPPPPPREHDDTYRFRSPSIAG